MGIRVVLTTRCQLSCSYCHREGWFDSQIGLDASSQDVILACKQLSATYGRDVTLTGGEPLLNKDFESTIHALKDLEFNITLLTNGQLLLNYLKSFEPLQCVHVSLPTLDTEEYFKITGGPIGPVINGIFALRETYAALLIKVNCVVGARYENLDQFVLDMVDLTTQLGAILKFIARFDRVSRTSRSTEQIINTILGMGYRESMYNGRVRTFNRFNGSLVEISEVSCAAANRYPNPCDTCKRWSDIYVGVDGKIFQCPWEMRG